MKKALIITVGVGVGENKESVTDSLAHAIYYSIKGSSPNIVYFVVTKESKNATIPKLKDYMGKLPSHRFVLLDNEEKDDIEEAYKKIKKIIEDLKNKGYEVTVDFTSGTKAMSAGAALAANKELVNLKYISGKREGGTVVKGKEKAIEIFPTEFFIDVQEDLIKRLFNNYQYDACLEAISTLKKATSEKEVVEKLETYQKIVEAYSLWDKFNHHKAWEILKNIKSDGVDIAQNKKFLGMLNSKKENDEIVEEFLIADLLNNAMRRIEEGKYDDAVARLYRCIEMIAQYRLKKEYGIDASNVDTWKLKIDLGMEEKLVEKYEKRAEKGIVKLALQQDYELLRDLGDELGNMKEDKELNNLLKKRNDSILAHGTTPISKEDAEKLYEKVIEMASKVIKDLKKKMKRAEFPKL
ncbi:MAG: TIGR02710 family CRISPR-associated protein [Thermoplasmata archaeon]|nr:TIGR02710 family CRISPR-associated protein [Thermoplasmata archaeon]